ncbi:MAG: hypothetical protein ACI8Y4_003014 [Candidatus Poriferisodalaceae bacterium]
MQEELVETDAEHCYRPSYVGHRAWLGVRLGVPNVDWAEVEAIVRDAYRQVAPKALTNLLDTEQP